MALLTENMEAAQAELQAANAEVQAARTFQQQQRTGQGVGTGAGQGVGTGVVAPAAPAPPPAPAAPPPTSQAKTEEVRKKLADAQEQVKKRREEAEKQDQKLQELVIQLKGYLIEALASYGDSLTAVKPNEYINLVITTDSDGYGFLIGSTDPVESRPRKEIISVQKSVITDYKAGRITLDGFKQKVLQYNE